MDYGLLDKLALQYGTDKASSKHGYTRYYEHYFGSIKNDVKKILELGVYYGSSLKMWKNYFLNATIYGIDINPDCSRYEEERIKISIGDFNNKEFILSFIENSGAGFDIVIDDASHINKDQIAAFKLIFPYVKSKGIYVIEDATTSYFKNYGGGLRNPDTAIEFFKNAIDDVFLSGFTSNRRLYANRDYSLASTGKKFSELEKIIESIHFYSGLIVVFKQ